MQAPGGMMEAVGAAGRLSTPSGTARSQTVFCRRERSHCVSLSAGMKASCDI